MNPELAAHHRLLLRVLTEPATVTTCSSADWELLLRLLQTTKLLGHLACKLEESGLLPMIPVRAERLLRSKLIESRSLQRQMSWELDRISWALTDSEIPVIVLKGAAYKLAGLPIAAGRNFADLDILVARENLDSFESLLLSKGWVHPKMSAYDEHYYRAWSHEIPAFVHHERRTAIDVHHALAPLTSTMRVNTEQLIDDAIPAHLPCYRILCPVDMVLHCAVNLFQNNELADDLRDLFDLDAMLRDFSGKDTAFWSALISRANQLRLGKVLFYGLRYARLICASPIPEKTEYELQLQPTRVSRGLMDRLVPLALLPLDPDHPAAWPRIARLVLFVRSHWIRMPLHLLVVHVAYKSYTRIRDRYFPAAI